MNRIKTKKKENIVQVLRRMYLLIAIIPMIVMTIITAVFYVNSLIDSTKQNLQTVLNLYADNIDGTISQGIKVIDIVQNDLSVQNALRVSRFEEKEEYYIQRTTINTTMMLINQNYGNTLDGIYILLDDGRCFKSSVFPYNKEKYSQQQWYKDIRDTQGIQGNGFYKYSRVIANPGKEGYISIGEPIINYRNGEIVGVILVEINLNTFSEMLSKTVTTQDLNVSITEEDGTPVWQYDLGEIRKKGNILKTHLDESIHRELSNGWEISMTTNWFNKIKTEVLNTLTILFILIIMVTFASIYFGRRFADTINHPLKQLQDGMNRNREIWRGEYIAVETEYHELDDLNEGVNDLISKVNQMFEEVKNKERAMRKVQFSALQAQVNPHFLYNMLDHISWQIRVEQYEKAIHSLMSLSKFFRISLRMEEEMVTLEKELDHAKIYADLQMIRYRDEISVEIVNDLDEQLMKTVIIPKFTLQPLIENAITHGLRDSGRKGFIRIHLMKSGDIGIIEIYDNGIGIAQENLKILRQALEKGTPVSKEIGGYGIVNVSQRIHYCYGDSYQVAIASKEGAYTSVKVIFPIK